VAGADLLLHAWGPSERRVTPETVTETVTVREAPQEAVEVRGCCR
jgi:hypothetical protein